MKVCIVTKDIPKAKRTFLHLKESFPLIFLSFFDPDIHEYNDYWNQFDFLILDTHPRITEFILSFMAIDITYKCLLRINENSKLDFDILKHARIYNTFSSPINKTELNLKIAEFLDYETRSYASQIHPKLTNKQNRILEILKFRTTAGASRENLMRLVWGEQKVVAKNIDVQINKIRSIIKSEGKSITCNQGRWFLRV